MYLPGSTQTGELNITLRKATQEDCEAICKIHVSAIRELGKNHYSASEINVWSRGRTPQRYEKHIRERKVIIAQHQSLPVGFGTLDLKNGDIVQLYISPEYARKRIGTLILEKLLSIAKEAGLREVHCMSSLNAETFYINSGFHPGQKCKLPLNRGEIDCILMKKVIT